MKIEIEYQKNGRLIKTENPNNLRGESLQILSISFFSVKNNDEIEECAKALREIKPCLPINYGIVLSNVYEDGTSASISIRGIDEFNEAVHLFGPISFGMNLSINGTKEKLNIFFAPMNISVDDIKNEKVFIFGKVVNVYQTGISPKYSSIEEARNVSLALEFEWVHEVKRFYPDEVFDKKTLMFEFQKNPEFSSPARFYPAKKHI